MSKHLLLLVLSAVIISSYSNAQSVPCKQPKPTCADDTFSIRSADIMWRKRLFLRIDLQEKANSWITRGELYQQSDIDVSATRARYTDQGMSANREGLVRALFDGWARGSIGAYKPNELLCPLTYGEFEQDLQGTAPVPGAKDSTAAPAADDGLGDDFGDFGGEDDLGGDFGDFGDEFAADATVDASTTVPAENALVKLEYEYTMYVLEDRMFDKVRSEIRNNILYIVLTRLTPGSNVLKEVAAFKYCEIREFLQTVEVRNRFDDSGGKTAAEVFENHLYVYIISTYGSDLPPSIWAAEQRNQQMVEFEHHLWSY